MIISSADHHDLSAVCHTQDYRIVGQQKSGPLQPVEEGGMQAHPSHQPPYGSALTTALVKFVN